MVFARKWFFFASLIVLPVIFAGCGGGEKPPAQPGEAPRFQLFTPPEAEQLYKQAEEAYAAGKIPAAITLWEKIAQKYPDSAIAAKSLDRLGRICLAQGSPERALQYYDYIIYTFPRWDGLGKTQVSRLRALSQTGKRKVVMKEAIPLWESLASNPEARFDLALLMVEVYFADNDIETAWDWSLAGSALAGAPEEKRQLTKVTLDALRNADEPTVRKLYKKNPNDFMRVFLDFRLAQIDSQKGQGEEVRERLRTMLNQNTMHPIAPEIQAALRGSRAESAAPLKADRIGVLVPLNGPNARYGDMVVRGLSVANAKWNSRYPDQKVTLVIKDSSSDPAVAEKAFNELVHKDGVLAVIGPIGAQQVKKVAVPANREGIPLLTLTQKEEEMRDNSFVLHVFMDSRDLVRTLVKHAREKLGIARFAVLYPDDHYGQTLSKIFAEVVQEQGGNLLASASYKEKSTDFREPLQKLLTIAKKNAPLSVTEPAPFDALFIPDQVQTVSLIAPQLPYNNIVGITLLGTNLWSEGPLVEAGGAYVEQAVFATPFNADSQNPVVRAFREDFEAAYNATPSYLEAQAYDALLMLLQARGAGGSSRPPERISVLQKLLQTRNFKGAAGNYSINQSGDFERQYSVYQVLNGQVTQVSQ